MDISEFVRGIPTDSVYTYQSEQLAQAVNPPSLENLEGSRSRVRD